MAISLLNLQQTSGQKIYESTCLDLIRELSKDLSEDTPTGESFTSVNGIDKCVEEINFNDQIKKLYQKYHNPDITIPEEVSPQTYWNKFNTQLSITKVGDYNMSIKECIELAAEVKKEVKDKFYGILLMTKGEIRNRIIFNPLHPIIVSELIREETSIKLDEKKWSASIYTWNENINSKKEYREAFKQHDYIDEIATIISSINVPSKYITENKNFNVDIVNDQFVMNYEQTKRLKESGELLEELESEGKNYIIPGQIINISGVAYPYYNVIYSRKGLAWNLSPMYGANISHPNRQSTSRGMEGGSRICTSSGNSNTQNGVSSLNHCNTTSPLNKNILTTGSLTYAGQCVDASLEIFLGDSYSKSIPEKALTFQEFKAENEGNGTKAQYLTYIKNRLNETMTEPEEEIITEPTDTSGIMDRTEPIDLRTIETEAEDEAALAERDLQNERIRPWSITQGYVAGDYAVRRGWIYRANDSIIPNERPEPSATSQQWDRIRPIGHETVLEPALDVLQTRYTEEQRETLAEMQRAQTTA